ncbi:MAG TPA: hypothetical protein VGC90_10365 [Candidatus Limnocylindrales bacterium]|jgi:hypothetical protein
MRAELGMSTSAAKIETRDDLDRSETGTPLRPGVSGRGEIPVDVLGWRYEDRNVEPCAPETYGDTVDNVPTGAQVGF